MRKKEIRIKGRTYTRRIRDNIPVPALRQTEREKRRSRDVPIELQSVTNTDIGIERERKRETRIKRWTYTRTMSDNIADHYYRYSRKKSETNKIQ